MHSTVTILLVDDEEPVRRTFEDWLREAGLDVHILAASDAESALQMANEHIIDLAVLDWALGAGDDGLQLLQDLYEFHPNVTAIMITGFANQATPLDAMRMGVRDYLDKNQDLDRETFLRAVRRQLDMIRPAKRERQVHESLAAFREAVQKILPLVQSTAALNDPIAVPEAMSSLFRFLRETTLAQDAVLVVRHYDAEAELPETCRAYNADGERLDAELVPFQRSLAASVVSLQEPRVMKLDDANTTGAIELQPFERGRTSLLAAPLAVTADMQVVLELFDKQSSSEFTEQDRRIVGAAADFGGELFRQTLSHRRMHQVLFDAVESALQAGQNISDKIGSESATTDESPPDAVMRHLREGLQQSAADTMSADDSLRLAEAIRILAQRHGDPAVRHCIVLVEQLRKLLDDMMEI